MARRIAFVGALELHFELEIGTQPGRVREQMPDRDPLLPIPAELGNELRHRIVEADAALLHQLHHARRRRDDFRQGGEVEDRVFRHRLGRRLEGAVAEARVIQNWSPRPTRTTAPGSSRREMAASTSGGDRREAGRRLDRFRAWACAPDRRRKARAHRDAQGGGDCGFHAIQYILSAVTALAVPFVAPASRLTRPLGSLKAALFFRGISHASPSSSVSRRAGRVLRCRAGQRRRRANRPRRRHRQGRGRAADQGRHDHRRKPERVAEQLHRDDRRQRPLLDHRPADRPVDVHRAGAGLRAEAGR